MGHEEPSPSQIADHIGVTRGTVTGLMDGLERDGFIERYHDPRDRRGLTIRITDKSRTFIDGFLPNMSAVLQRVLPLNEEEKEAFSESLGRIESELSRIKPSVGDGCLME